MAGVPKKHRQRITGNRMTAIIIGILLVVLGVLLFAFPLASVLFANIFILIGLLVYGVYLIFAFIVTPKGFRDGWTLGSGIVLVVCALLILASSASSIIVSFAVILGLVALMIGINEIISYSTLRGIKGSGYLLVAGIINILLALFLFIAPFVAATAVAIVQGVYLCFAGIALVIEGFAKRSLSLD